MHSRKMEIGGLVALCVMLSGCGSDSSDGVIRPLPSNKGGMAVQHHPGQVVTLPAATGGQTAAGQAPGQGK